MTRATARPDRRSMLAGGALLVAALAAEALRPRSIIPSGSIHLDDLFPQKVGAWEAEDDHGIVPAQPEDVALFYDQVTARTYRRSGAPPVMLLASWGDGYDGKRFVHRPENCYAAAGFDIGPSKQAVLDGGNGLAIPVRTLTAKTRWRTEQIAYWVRIGDALPANAWDQRLDILSDNLGGLAPDGLLLRLSSIVPEPAPAMQAFGDLTRALLTQGSPDLRRMLLGAHARTE